MAVTSGTAVFNIDLNDIIEESYERAGIEVRTGYEFRTARRSLNMLTIEWANRGINLWTIEQGQIVMNTGQPIYAYPADTIDLLDQVIRTQANGINHFLHFCNNPWCRVCFVGNAEPFPTISLKIFRQLRICGELILKSVYFLVGKEYGCDVTAMVANTGTAMGDSNGYEVTLSAIEAEAPYKLQSSVVTSLGI